MLDPVLIAGFIALFVAVGGVFGSQPAGGLACSA